MAQRVDTPGVRIDAVGDAAAALFVLSDRNEQNLLHQDSLAGSSPAGAH